MVVKPTAGPVRFQSLGLGLLSCFLVTKKGNGTGSPEACNSAVGLQSWVNLQRMICDFWGLEGVGTRSWKKHSRIVFNLGLRNTFIDIVGTGDRPTNVTTTDSYIYSFSICFPYLTPMFLLSTIFLPSVYPASSFRGTEERAYIIDIIAFPWSDWLNLYTFWQLALEDYRALNFAVVVLWKPFGLFGHALACLSIANLNLPQLVEQFELSTLR